MMTSALKWALATSTITVGIIVVALAYDPRQGPLWVRGALSIALLGVPVGGGVITALRGGADRRAGRSPGQARVALGLALALITLGVGLLLVAD